MISRDFFYIPPRLRIEIGGSYLPEWPSYSERDEMWRLQRLAEGERIWKLVQEACA